MWVTTQLLPASHVRFLFHDDALGNTTFTWEWVFILCRFSWITITVVRCFLARQEAWSLIFMTQSAVLVWLVKSFESAFQELLFFNSYHHCHTVVEYFILQSDRIFITIKRLFVCRVLSALCFVSLGFINLVKSCTRSCSLVCHFGKVFKQRSIWLLSWILEGNVGDSHFMGV